jgi:hypothetical protein
MIPETGDRPEDDARLVRRFEWLLVALVTLLVPAHGRDEAWPFNVWPVYVRGHQLPPQRVSETELRLVCHDGEVNHLFRARLFNHVEVDLGRAVA